MSNNATTTTARGDTNPPSAGAQVPQAVANGNNDILAADDHNLILRTFDDRLGTAPPNDPDSKVGRVLDVGTGSGIWAIDFGDEHPEADVTGIDLSPVQITLNLNPGGYLELNDVDAIPVSDDGTLTEDSSFMKAVRLWSEGLAILGSPFEDFSRLEGVMKDVGFEDIHVKRFKWPTNSWPKDRKHKELGIWNYENLSPNWEGFLMAPLTRAMNWTKEEVLILAMEARRDSANKNIHAYYNM
ncbi:methyltransferase domain-containing protein [Colletotrichum tofieldiae]|nr:methyltransferase domain-containing protein [Colletotrichum tofieldiae]GKT79755.1 methyltransferase domain-containing protein [Colletotrichum tofieldiae]